MDTELKNDNFHNVAIFIDYENVHKTLLDSNTNAIIEASVIDFALVILLSIKLDISREEE